MSTPALRALRQHFPSSEIWFLAKHPVRQVLSPCSFNDQWLEPPNNSPFVTAIALKRQKFTHAILLANSFRSALAVALARIPSRIGYARDGRGPLLTGRLHPPKLPNGRFKPISAIDYYLAAASSLGAAAADRMPELRVKTRDSEQLMAKLPELADRSGPIVVIVPGAAFGPSKCWLPERFAQTADWLIDKYKAVVVTSVAPGATEQQIANKISAISRRNLVNLAERPISLNELKALCGIADLVITNDTGPRHIAIALRRKVITLFGPNDPAWTDAGYEDEIRIIGDAPCAPCGKPNCRKPQHLCMKSITVEMVCSAAEALFGRQ